MALPVVDTLFDTFGPFLVPVVLFVAGAVGYAVLLFAGRLLTSGAATEIDDDTADADCGEG